MVGSQVSLHSSFLILFILTISELSVSSKKSNAVVPDVLEVELAIQSGDETKRQILHFTSIQLPDRVAASFCFRHRCREYQAIQIEKLIHRIQTTYNSSSMSQARWKINDTEPYLPVFFHHPEGLTEFQTLRWKNDIKGQGENDMLLRKKVKEFCKVHNCSELAGHNPF